MYSFLLNQPEKNVESFWTLGFLQIVLVLIYLFLIFLGVRFYFRVMLYLKKKIELTDKQLNE